VGLADLRIVLGPDGEVTVQGPADTLVARLHGTRDVQLAHALLLVRGRALRQAVRSALGCLEAMAKCPDRPLPEVVRRVRAQLAVELNCSDVRSVGSP
jgi:hypothetical protein